MKHTTAGTRINSNCQDRGSRSDAAPSVAVIGGGITGLTAAFRLQERGVPVTLYEAGGRVGGVIKTIRRNGYLAESGPNTILETSPKVIDLVDDLGLEGRRLYSNPTAKNRYVVHNHKLVNMPSSPAGFVATPLFSAAAKLRLLAEPFVPRAPEVKEESVAEFVVRRLGREFLDNAIDALVSGIYAGDPEKLSVPHAFPRLRKLETRYGSLLKGQIFGAGERGREREVAKPNAPKFSFDEGLQVLTDALCDRIKDNVRLFSPVTEIAQTESGWAIMTNGGGTCEQHRHSSVLYAGTAFRLPKIHLISGRYLNAAPIARIEYPPVASVVLGYRRDQVAHPLDGFGMLIPRCEGFSILGTIFSSSLFPHRAPEGHVTLTSYLGGARSPDLARLAEDELFRLARADLGALLGALGQPTEEALAALWKELLGIQLVGRNDNFFEVGGHSMRAMQLVARAGKRFGVDLTLRNVFEKQTLAEMAEVIEALSWAKLGKKQAAGHREVLEV